MASWKTLLTCGFLGALGVSGAMADCQMADAKLEEAILEKPELRGAHRQTDVGGRSVRGSHVRW
jgi:hypothetical protein